MTAVFLTPVQRAASLAKDQIHGGARVIEGALPETRREDHLQMLDMAVIDDVRPGRLDTLGVPPGPAVPVEPAAVRQAAHLPVVRARAALTAVAGLDGMGVPAGAVGAGVGSIEGRQLHIAQRSEHAAKYSVRTALCESGK